MANPQTDGGAAAAAMMIQRMRAPLVLDDTNTVAHAYWNGSALVDKYGNSWTQVGTVPQVARSGRTPPGAGPFSDTNYYSLGAGSDVLDFAGDFSFCAICNPLDSGANSPVLISNGTFNADGWFLQRVAGGASTTLSFNASGTGSPITDTYALPTGIISAVCGGRSGSTGYLKVNLRTLITGTAGTITAAATTPARIGRYPVPTLSFNGYVYEIWASTTAPSDALFTIIQQRIKQKVGITSW